MGNNKTRIMHLEDKHVLARYPLIVSCDADELQLYLFMKLHAITKSVCFPSWATIMEQLDWGRDKLNATIKRMEVSGRLRVERTNGRTSLYDITWYDRCNQSEKPTGRKILPVGKADGGRSEKPTATSRKSRPERLGKKRVGIKRVPMHESDADEPRILEAHAGAEPIAKVVSVEQVDDTLKIEVETVAPPPPEETPEQKQRNKSIAAVIDVFVKGGYRVAFGNQTERDAAGRLIDAMGEAPVLSAASVAVEANKQPFAPKITKPSLLEAKMQELRDWYTREIRQRKRKQEQSVAFVS